MKHLEIEERIRQMICTGEGVSADGRLLSERELASHFGVSRTTVRKAVDSLSRQGHLIPLHGKGTFVKDFQDLRYSQSLYSVTRCAQNYAELGMEPSVTVLKQEVIPATEAIAAHLQLQKGDPVLRIEKLYQANRLILNLSESFLTLVNFPKIERQDFSVTTLQVLREKYSAYPTQTAHTIEAVLPSAGIAAQLKITEGTPILLFESLTTGVCSGRFFPLEYFRVYHRTDHLRFSFTQMHGAHDGNPPLSFELPLP
ncbi:MAG: GntR family transcriptional regulator [Butyricicoccus sp.]|nr:GntR family transcriptional regulator [Butyricicoccus sp.]